MNQTLEQAERELTDCEAAAAEARRILEEATAAVETASSEVALITTQIEDHDGGDGIEILAAKRAAAFARVEALTSRARAKEKTLAEALAATRAASVAVATITLATERQRVAELDQALKERIEAFGQSCDEARIEIQTHCETAQRSGVVVSRSRGAEVQFASYAHSAFATIDQIVAAFKAALDASEGKRRSARRAENDQREAEERQQAFDRKRERAAAAPPTPQAEAVVTTVLSFTPQPRNETMRNDLD